METFDRKINKLKNKYKHTIIIVSIITLGLLILAIAQIIPREKTYSKFNKTNKSSIYVEATVNYMIGPILQTNSSKEESFYYYLAVEEDENMFIIKMKENSYNIPILGKDVDEEEIEGLDRIEIKGVSEDISTSLHTAFGQRIDQLLKAEVSNSNKFSEFIGYYYFDCDKEVQNASKNLLMSAGIFVIIDVLYIMLYKKNVKKINDTLNKLKDNQKLEEVKNEYEGGQVIEYKMLNVSILPNYVMCFFNGLNIIAYRDIKEIYATRQINGNKNKYKYMVIETKAGETYYVTVLRKRTQNKIFEELLAKIKSKV